MSARWPQDGGLSSSAKGGTSTSSSAGGIGPGKGSTSAPLSGTGTSSPSASGPTNAEKLTLQDVLLILQEDLRNLQRMGLGVVVVNLPEEPGVAIGLYGPVRFIRGSLKVVGEGSQQP